MPEPCRRYAELRGKGRDRNSKNMFNRIFIPRIIWNSPKRTDHFLRVCFEYTGVHSIAIVGLFFAQKIKVIFIANCKTQSGSKPSSKTLKNKV